MIFTSPARYLQGPGVLDALPAEVAVLGDRALFIVDSGVRDSVGQAVVRRFEAAGVPLQVSVFSGEVTQSCVDAFLLEARRFNADVVIGAGGGKALDASKAVALALDAPFCSVPTIAATDAPASFAIAMYDERHELIEVRRLRRNPELVLVDSTVICGAPLRFLRAGIGDAISKFYETRATVRAGAHSLHGTPPSRMGIAAATLCRDLILEHGEPALREASARQPGPHVEALLEATVLLSSMASENGGLSIAHAVARGIPMLARGARSLHGEHVAYGLLVQLALEDAQEELAQIRHFFSRVGLPVRLADLGLENLSPAEMDTLLAGCQGSGGFSRFERKLGAADIAAAIRAVECREGATA